MSETTLGDKLGGGLMSDAWAGIQRRDVYQASGARRTILSFALLLLAPFLMSLGPMLYQRVSAGLWGDLPGFVIFGVVFLVIGALVFTEFLRSILSKVEIGETEARVVLPAGRGPTPFLRYAAHTIPYDQVAAVETRREIYGGWVAPVLMRGARVILKDGTTIKLGYVSEANVDPVMPYPLIAQQIAEKAGVPVTETGNVWRLYHRKIMGIKMDEGSPTGVAEDKIDDLNRSHNRFVMGLVAVMVVLLGVGIALDAPQKEGTPLAKYQPKAE